MSEARQEAPAMEAFRVTDDAAAEWCLRKIREANADTEKWRAHYAEQMRKVEEANRQTVAYMEAKLQEYFEIVPHKATATRQTYNLPGGRLILKKQQPQFTTDDVALVPWLKNNFMEHLVKVRESADWAGLKACVTVTPDGEHVATDDGEIVPGVTVIQRPDVFKVEMEDQENG